MRVATIKDNVIINVTVAPSLEEAIAHFPDHEVISIEEPYDLLLDNGTIMPAWLGIDWRKEGDQWIPPFSLDIPVTLDIPVRLGTPVELTSESGNVTDEEISTQ
jgi:hypothetical protein